LEVEMMQITERAATYLERLRSEKGLDGKSGVRFVRNGAKVALRFAPAPEKGDRVVRRDGLAVYLAPEVVEKFDRSIVDARTREARTWLVLRKQTPAS
jgi:Fe-S cluster assembly iron-binding protein IscA